MSAPASHPKAHSCSARVECAREMHATYNQLACSMSKTCLCNLDHSCVQVYRAPSLRNDSHHDGVVVQYILPSKHRVFARVLMPFLTGIMIGLIRSPVSADGAESEVGDAVDVL